MGNFPITERQRRIIMSIKKIISAVIAAAFVLSLTACSNNEKPSGNSGGAGAVNSANGSTPVTSGAGDSVPASKPGNGLDIWDNMPEIPVTDASAFEYGYDSFLKGKIVTNYMGEATKIRIPDTYEGEPIVGVHLMNCEKELTQIVMPDSVKAFGLSQSTRSALQYINIPKSMTELGQLLFENYKSLTSITIPDSVTKISNYAFMNCSSLTSVTIPGTVTEIGNCSFSSCTSLTSVTVENGVTKIDDGAFEVCTSLISITIPESVTEIGKYVFNHCESLTNIDIDSDNPNYCSIDGVVFSKDKTELKTYPNGKSTSYIIPDGVTVIGYGAFVHCPSLTSVVIPNSVTEIGINAFRNCPNLTGVTIPDSVTTIGDFAFDECSSISATYKGQTYDNAHIKDLYRAINS